MRPATILPFHDPTGLLYEHLQAALPSLKAIFAQAFVSMSPATVAKQPAIVDALASDSFFNLNFNEPNSLPGEHYLAGYQNAVNHCPPQQSLHLCDIDKVAYALHAFREPFLTDVVVVEGRGKKRPFLFQRSPTAWESYPANYRQIEHFVIEAGKMLFGRYYDFAWSYFVLTAGQLAQILPHIQSRDFGLLIEMVLLLRNQLETKEVDWLAWEDPFLFRRDAAELRDERESSQQETRKRLRGSLPFFQHLLNEVAPIGQIGWER